MLESGFLALLLLDIVKELLEFGSEMREKALNVSLWIDSVIIASILSDGGIRVMSVALLNWFM